MTVPNILTLCRIVFIPIFIVLYHEGHFLWSFFLLGFMFLTDFLDGYLARTYDWGSDLGALLDPIADKALVLSLYGYLYFIDQAPWYFVLMISIRNISQLLSIPILSWWLKKPFKVRPKWPAKWATALSFTCIPALMIASKVVEPFIVGAVNYVLVPASLMLETYIFVTYVPRLLQIATDKHDTFE